MCRRSERCASRAASTASARAPQRQETARKPLRRLDHRSYAGRTERQEHDETEHRGSCERHHGVRLAKRGCFRRRGVRAASSSHRSMAGQPTTTARHAGQPRQSRGPHLASAVWGIRATRQERVDVGCDRDLPLLDDVDAGDSCSRPDCRTSIEVLGTRRRRARPCAERARDAPKTRPSPPARTRQGRSANLTVTVRGRRGRGARRVFTSRLSPRRADWERR
jgi:hypothetical protein